jgi:hypothetical protein
MVAEFCTSGAEHSFPLLNKVRQRAVDILYFIVSYAFVPDCTRLKALVLMEQTWRVCCRDGFSNDDSSAVTQRLYLGASSNCSLTLWNCVIPSDGA